MRNRTRSLTPVLLFLAVTAAGPALAAPANAPCSLRDAAGDWEYTVTEVKDNPGPPTSVGSFHVDSDGHVRGTQTLTLGGFTVEGEILTGTVAVNPDCTGTTDLVISNTPFPRTAVLDLALENGSTELHTTFLTDAGEFSSIPLTDASGTFALEGRKVRHND